MRPGLPRTRAARTLVAVALVLLLLRVLLLLAALEPAEERVVEVFDPAGVTWAYGPERPLFDREELYTGTAAEAMRQGLPLPASTYQFMAYGGGSLLTAWAARFVYAVFGESYLAFKLLPLCVAVFGGIFWFAAIRRAFGERLALVFAALYALGPSTFVRTSLIAKGDHAEAMAWIGFVLWAALRSAGLGAPATTRRAWAGVAGVAAGFGVFITYSTAPVLAGVFLAALLLTRARPGPIWAWGAAGLALGLLPWLIAVISTGGDALQVYGRTLGSAASAMGERLRALCESGFFANYDLPGGRPVRQIVGLAFLGAVVLGWIAWGRQIARTLRPRTTEVRETEVGETDDAIGAADGAQRTSRLLLLALAGTSAHLAAFVVTAPDVASRYLVPVYPLLLLAVASLVAGPAGARAFGPQVLSRGLATIVAGAGGIALAFVFATSSWTATRLPLAGTDWPLLGEVVGQKLGPEEIAALPEEVRSHFWVGFGKKVFALGDRDRWPEAVGLAPEGEQGAVWEGVGIALVEGGAAFAESARIQALPPTARDALVRGMARYGEVVFAPVAANRPDIDLGAAELRMTGAPSELLSASRARSVATLAVHGAAVSANAWRGLAPDVAQRSLGIATFRGVGAGGIRRYPLRGAVLGRGGDDDPAVWAGLGAALGKELSLTTLSTDERRTRIVAMSASAPAAARDGFVRAAERSAGAVAR